MADFPDRDLVCKSQGGSQEAFVQLYHLYKGRILNFLYGYSGSFSAAQDLTQDAFLSAYKNLATLKDQDKFSSWLYAIATNLAKNYLTKSKRERADSIDAPIGKDCNTTLGDVIPSATSQPDNGIEHEMVQERIQSTLNELPDLYKEVLLLCDVQGMSYEEAAAVLNCPVGTIGSRLNEARKKFRQIYSAKNGA